MYPMSVSEVMKKLKVEISEEKLGSCFGIDATMSDRKMDLKKMLRCACKYYELCDRLCETVVTDFNHVEP